LTVIAPDFGARSRARPPTRADARAIRRHGDIRFVWLSLCGFQGPRRGVRARAPTGARMRAAVSQNSTAAPPPRGRTERPAPEGTDQARSTFGRRGRDICATGPAPCGAP
jgi:hypothetical protein